MAEDNAEQPQQPSFNLDIEPSEPKATKARKRAAPRSFKRKAESTQQTLEIDKKPYEFNPMDERGLILSVFEEMAKAAPAERVMLAKEKLLPFWLPYDLEQINVAPLYANSRDREHLLIERDYAFVNGGPFTLKESALFSPHAYELARGSRLDRVLLVGDNVFSGKDPLHVDISSDEPQACRDITIRDSVIWTVGGFNFPEGVTFENCLVGGDPFHHAKGLHFKNTDVVYTDGTKSHYEDVKMPRYARRMSR